VKRILFLLCVSLSLFAHSSQLPSGFVEQLIAQNLDPTDLVIAPDGRIFITIKSGKIMMVQNGVMSATPFLNIPVYNYNEAGLCHMVLDPNFNVNHYYYVYYTVSDATHNRLSRFTANGNVTLAGSEVVLLELDPGSLHNGGDLAFGLDGKLYVAVGEGNNPNNPQSFGSLLGKVLRLNQDGTIPSDNPFFNDATVTGKNKAIWALGFRNPFSLDIQPGTGKIFLSDTGADKAEEVNEVQAGKNYGWPLIEGMRTNEVAPANYKDPRYVYGHGFTAFTGCAIVAAAFYNPVVNQFPSQYVGQFFYADYCNGYINYIDPATATPHTFATGINRPVAVVIASDGTLYYLARAGLGGSPDANTSSTDGTLWKVAYTGSGSPVISVQPQNKLAVVGDDVNFIMSASGAQPLSYQWMVNGAPIAGATQASYTLAKAQLTDNNKKFSCTVSNSFGSATTQEATLTVNENTRPVPQFTVTLPGNATLYQAGQTIAFSGGATDNEDGTLPPSALTWKIDFHHELHFHPALPATSGITSGSFTIPKSGETNDHVWYRVILTATDSKGLATSVYQDIFPQKVSIILSTTPKGLPLNLDGQPIQTSDTVIAVVGVTRTLNAPATSTISGSQYLFSGWTPSVRTPSITFDVPEKDSSFTASYSDISIEPQSALLSPGDDIVFTVSASSPQALTYQWLINGTPITGSTQASYTFTNAKLADDGKKISCKVSNSYGSVTPQGATLSIRQRSQTITFSELVPVTFGIAPFTLTAHSTSELPVSFTSSDQTKAIIAGTRITIVGAGIVTITAKQAGDAHYNPALDVSQILVIDKAAQTIFWLTPPTTKTFGDVPFTLSATSSSNLPVRFSSPTDKVSISDHEVTLMKPGRVTITADQPGNTNFKTAASVSQSFCINPPKPSITTTTLNTETQALVSSSLADNQWYKNDILIPDATSNTLVATSEGTYTVKVTVNNCASEFSAAQSIVVTGETSPATTSDFFIYPNPATDQLTINLQAFDAHAVIDIIIYDSEGRVLEKISKNSEAITIPLGSYSPGKYSIKAIQQNRTYTSKFIKN
jgi:glucose/arabinose dehydrogenase